MSDWYDTFNSVFWLSFSAALFAFCGVSLGYCFKSKCSETNICYGLIQIKRNVEAENKEEEMQLEHGAGPSDRRGSIV